MSRRAHRNHFRCLYRSVGPTGHTLLRARSVAPWRYHEGLLLEQCVTVVHLEHLVDPVALVFALLLSLRPRDLLDKEDRQICATMQRQFLQSTAVRECHQ
jgi:hypothetical protein